VSGSGYLLAVATASGLVGLWLVVRLPALAPRSLRGAGACFASAWILPALAVPLLEATMARLPLGPAILVAIFPPLTATFALVGAGLRYVAGLTDHAVR
jgi:hypothetical protein